MPILDDDDRAYSAAIDSGDTGEWYPEWKGPDTGAFEEWMDFLRLNGESHTCDDEPEFPEVNISEFPFA